MKKIIRLLPPNIFQRNLQIIFSIIFLVTLFFRFNSLVAYAKVLIFLLYFFLFQTCFLFLSAIIFIICKSAKNKKEIAYSDIKPYFFEKNFNIQVKDIFSAIFFMTLILTIIGIVDFILIYLGYRSDEIMLNSIFLFFSVMLSYGASSHTLSIISLIKKGVEYVKKKN